MYTARRRQSLACDQTARRVSQQRHKTLLLCVVDARCAWEEHVNVEDKESANKHQLFKGGGGKKFADNCDHSHAHFSHTRAHARTSLSHTHTRTCLQSPKVPINMHVFHQSHCPTFARTHWLLRDALWPRLKRETLCTHAPGCTALWAIQHGTVCHPLWTLDFITCPPSLRILWSSSVPRYMRSPPCTHTHKLTRCRPTALGS